MSNRLVNFVSPSGFTLLNIPQTLNITTPDFNREILIGGSIELSFSAMTDKIKEKKKWPRLLLPRSTVLIVKIHSFVILGLKYDI